MAKTKLGLSLMALFLGTFAAQQMKAVDITTANLGTLSGPFTRTGTLANQGTALEATFSIAAASQLTIFTTSYGGGMNANGTTAAAGGFMPSLVLYNAGGNFVAGPTFPSPNGNMDPTTKINGDSYIKTGNLMAGTYILTLADVLVQQSPSATNLSDGFTNLGGGTTFADTSGNVRNATYALNITGANGGGPGPAVPEPATFWLAAPVLGMAGLWMRRRKTNS